MILRKVTVEIIYNEIFDTKSVSRMLIILTQSFVLFNWTINKKLTDWFSLECIYLLIYMRQKEQQVIYIKRKA